MTTMERRAWRWAGVASMAGVWLGASPVHAQTVWVAEQVVRASDPLGNATFADVFVHGAEDFRVAGVDDAGPFIAHFHDGAWHDEASPPSSVSFYEEDGALYALYAEGGTLGAMVASGDTWSDVDFFGTGPAAGWTSFFLASGQLFATAWLDGGDVPHFRAHGGFVDLCLGTSAPFLVESGSAYYGVTGLGYLYRHDDTGCAVRGVPGPDWTLIDMSRLPLGIATNTVRVVRGEVHVGQDRAVYTRLLSGGAWSSFPIDLDRGIERIAGPDADVYLGSRAGSVFDRTERVATTALGDADPDFLIHAVHWAADGTVVAVGDAAHVLRRRVEPPPPPPGEVRITLTAASLVSSELFDPTGHDGGFRLDVESTGVPVNELSFTLSTEPPVDLGGARWIDATTALSCAPGSSGLTCTLGGPVGMTVLDTGGVMSVEVPFTLRADETYDVGMVRLDVDATAGATDTDAAGTARATGLFVIDRRQADLGLARFDGLDPSCPMTRDGSPSCYVVVNLGPDTARGVEVTVLGARIRGASCTTDTVQRCVIESPLGIGDTALVSVSSDTGGDVSSSAYTVHVAPLERAVTDPDLTNNEVSHMPSNLPGTGGCAAAGAGARGIPPLSLLALAALALSVRRRVRCTGTTERLSRAPRKTCPRSSPGRSSRRGR